MNSLNANLHFDLFGCPAASKPFYQERLKKLFNFSHSSDDDDFHYDDDTFGDDHDDDDDDDDDDIYIMMKCLSVCLSVTKNDHFLLEVSCNHLNHP